MEESKWSQPEVDGLKVFKWAVGENERSINPKMNGPEG